MLGNHHNPHQLVFGSTNWCSRPPKPDWQEGGGKISLVQLCSIAQIIALSCNNISQICTKYYILTQTTFRRLVSYMWMIWQIESKVKVQTESNQLLASPEMVDEYLPDIFQLWWREEWKQLKVYMRNVFASYSIGQNPGPLWSLSARSR